jgi:putative ABC transport system ATP-binding protein
LNIIGALDRPSSGRVVLDGIDLSSLPERKLYQVRRDKVGFVFQLYYLLPSLTAWENVTVPAIPWNRGGLKEKASELLEMVGLGAARKAGSRVNSPALSSSGWRLPGR